MKVFFVICLCLYSGFLTRTGARKLPSYLKACSRNDPALNECALKNGRAAIPSVVKGDPKYKVPVFDPLVIERLSIDDSGNKAVGLKFVCEKCTILGLKDIMLEDIRIDIKKLHVEADFFIPKVDIIGKYNVSGKVLVLAIRGNGDVKLTLKGVKVKLILDFEVYKKKNGKEHLKIINGNFTSSSDGLQIHLTNLFNGDKKLGDTMNIFLNENGQELLKTFGPVLYEVFRKHIIDLFGYLIIEIPYDEIFPLK